MAGLVSDPMIILKPDQIQEAVEYTLRILLNCSDLEWITLKDSIAYGCSVPSNLTSVRLQICPSSFFELGIYGTVESLPSLPLKEINGVPLLYGSLEIFQKNNVLVIGADIVASAYFLLTRYEELVSKERDRFGRFPGKKSLPYRADFIHRPIVEEYGALLRQWLKRAGLTLPVQKSRFHITLTHDLDIPRYYKSFWSAVKVGIRACQSKATFTEALVAIGSRLGFCKDPLNIFDTMNLLAEKLMKSRQDIEVRTIYFVMAGGTSKYDRHYTLKDSHVKRLLKKIQQQEADIGLHASFEAGDNPDLVEQEKINLEIALARPVLKSRHHYLHLKEPRDMWGIHDAGIKDDYTMGYADCAGFRLGVCRPVPCFDPERMTCIPVVAHPLIVMDASLSGTAYMNLGREEALAYCLGLAGQVEKHQGELVLLWHNHFLGGPEGVFHLPLYTELLDRLGKQSVLV